MNFSGTESANIQGQPKSLGKAAQKCNVTFRKENVYLTPTGPPPSRAKLVGNRTAQNVYVTKDADSESIAAPSTEEEEEKENSIKPQTMH